jgi:hypothetical protein
MAKDHFESLGYTVLGGYYSPVSDGYGKKGLLSAAVRLDMCNLAVESSDWLMVDRWEATFPKWCLTYQVETRRREDEDKDKNDKDKELICYSRSNISHQNLIRHMKLTQATTSQRLEQCWCVALTFWTLLTLQICGQLKTYVVIKQLKNK